MGGNERERKLALSHEKLGGRQVEQGEGVSGDFRGRFHKAAVNRANAGAS